MDTHEWLAWNLYCEETAGSMDVKDEWWDLSQKVREMYLARVVDRLY